MANAMNDFSFDFQNFIDNKLNYIINNLKEKNPEYTSCREYIKENFYRVQSIIENLPEVGRKFMRTYGAKHFNEIALEQREFSYCGYMDCIKLLKWLGVI